jgi:hypothetical protein
MKIKLKNYYALAISVVVEPSKLDIEYGFFNKKEDYNLYIPCLFYSGQRFLLNCNCLSCNRQFEIKKNLFIRSAHKHTYFDVGILSPRRKNIKFIYNIMKLFNKLYINEYESVCLEGPGLAYLFYQKCPHCGAQYLATYCDIQGQPPERTEPATPYEFYIEEMAWVEFDEEEFFREMQKKD